MVKDTDFKLDRDVSRDSLDMTLYNFSKRALFSKNFKGVMSHVRTVPGNKFEVRMTIAMPIFNKFLGDMSGLFQEICFCQI